MNLQKCVFISVTRRDGAALSLAKVQWMTQTHNVEEVLVAEKMYFLVANRFDTHRLSVDHNVFWKLAVQQ